MVMPVGSGEASKQRRSAYSTITIPAAGTIVEVVSASENRVALILSPNSIGELQYSPQLANNGHQSINMPAQAGPLILLYEQVGDIVKKAWYVQFTSGGPSQVGVIETFTD